MGYTRYWRRPQEFDEARFSAFAKECIGIASAFADTLAVCECEQDYVHVEGKPGCEPFLILRISQGREREGLVTEFCKTQGLPYDVVVEQCLQALAAEFPEVQLPPPS